MNTEIYNYLNKKLGEELVTEHICPFAYEKQNKYLIQDIQSYAIHKRIIDFTYNEIRYPVDERINLFYDLLSYSGTYDLKENIRISKIIKNYDPYRTMSNICTVNNLLIANLTPSERAEFIKITTNLYNNSIPDQLTNALGLIRTNDDWDVEF